MCEFLSYCNPFLCETSARKYGVVLEFRLIQNQPKLSYHVLPYISSKHLVTQDPACITLRYTYIFIYLIFVYILYIYLIYVHIYIYYIYMYITYILYIYVYYIYIYIRDYVLVYTSSFTVLSLSPFPSLAVEKRVFLLPTDS